MGIPWTIVIGFVAGCAAWPRLSYCVRASPHVQDEAYRILLRYEETMGVLASL